MGFGKGENRGGKFQLGKGGRWYVKKGLSMGAKEKITTPLPKTRFFASKRGGE